MSAWGSQRTWSLSERGMHVWCVSGAAEAAGESDGLGSQGRAGFWSGLRNRASSDPLGLGLGAPTHIPMPRVVSGQVERLAYLAGLTAYLACMIGHARRWSMPSVANGQVVQML